MLKTLIVEDGEEKRHALAAALAQVDGFDMAGLDYAPDLFTARRALLEKSYELLILDIALPPRADEAVESDGGLRILEEMFSRPSNLRVPAHIIGITAYPDVFDNALDRFSSRLLTLVKYDPADSGWEESLQARVRHILRASTSEKLEAITFGSFLCVVCALQSPELAAVLRLPWSWSEMSVPRDHTMYWRGTVNRNGEQCSVYAAATARMGIPAASILAMKMIQSFRPQFLAMTGMTAGVRGRVELGDIIVADASWDWGSGKWTLEGTEARFLAAPHQLRLAVGVREKFRKMAQDTGMLSEIRSEWPGEPPPTALSIRVGPMASGTSVLADRHSAERIIDQHRELLGIEMETYGIFAAAEESSEPRPIPFALKAVVDFADGRKDDRFQAFGAFASATVLRHFVGKYL
jgi:nucleoside phosphorylase/CheY-like chemotaxis protein